MAIIALALFCIALLLQPEIFSRLRLLELGGFKLELLEKVKEKQARQETQLEDITLMLPLLLPKAERTHLLDLADGGTADCKGNHALRSELRRLRSMGLIKMRADHKVGEMKDGSVVDLNTYLEITDLGQRWARRIRQIEESGALNGSGKFIQPED